MSQSGLQTLVVDDAGAGERIDRFLTDRLELSRTRVQKLMDAGDVKVMTPNGPMEPRKSEPLEVGWTIEVLVPEAKPVPEILPEDIPISIVFEDEDLAVVDKAAGMVVHPAPGHRTGTLVHAALFHLDSLAGVGGRMRPGIVHRLDRDTSGLMVMAKADRAHVALSEALRKRKVKRLYRTLVWGHLREDPVTIDAPIARDPRNRKKMAVVEDGRRAVTRVRRRASYIAAEFLDVALETGRTHQIRVHLAHLGHPVVGDTVYGRGGAKGIGGAARRWATDLERMAERQFLHAAELVFLHPVSGEKLHFKAPLPADLAAIIDWATEGEETR